MSTMTLSRPVGVRSARCFMSLRVTSAVLERLIAAATAKAPLALSPQSIAMGQRMRMQTTAEISPATNIQDEPRRISLMSRCSPMPKSSRMIASSLIVVSDSGVSIRPMA